MPLDDLDSRAPRSRLIDLAILTALCAFLYLFGITDFGTASWHESIRLVTAMDMQARGEWIVPTVMGTPYLSKPPLLYWVTIIFAEIAGQQVSLLHLRLAIALFGWLTVVLTYLTGRSLFMIAPGWSASRSAIAAFWAALFLATGFLHVRLSRTGAIDMSVAPFVVAAVWIGLKSWQQSRSWKLSPLLTAGMFVVAVGASLAKGPPTLLAIATALFGGTLGWLAVQQRPARSPILRALPSLAALAVLVIGLSQSRNTSGIVGPVVSAFLAGWFVWGFVRLCSAGLIESLRTLWVSQLPAAVVGSLGSILIWSQLVASRIGTGSVQSSAVTEMNENITIFDPEASSELFMAAVFGCGLGSLYAFAGCWLLITRRVRFTPGVTIVAAWVGLSLLAFMAFSTGSTRYITPILPGVALLGAIAWVHFRSGYRREWMSPVTAAIVILLAVGQAWWYGAGRDRIIPTQSPRDFMAELVAREDVDSARIVTYGFWNGDVLAYAGHDIWPVQREGYGMDDIVGAWSFDKFIATLHEDGKPWTMLVTLKRQHAEGESQFPDEFTSLGLRVTPIELDAKYAIRNGRIPVRAYRISPE